MKALGILGLVVVAIWFATYQNWLKSQLSG
jgi:hypothetical protein